MADKDLSQNIELNVSINPQSIKKAQDDLNSLQKDFMVELRKELGFGQNTKIRVGGYSTGESPDRTVRNKAASKVEKMGGDWSGIDIADKAEVEVAKNINEAAKELAQRIGVKFVDQFAATIGEADFALPDNALPAEKLAKTIEDFIVDAAGGVTISPAMLLAASERVYKNNPNISVPGGLTPSLTGAISPTNIFPQGADFSEEVTKQFNEFLERTIDSPSAAAAVQGFLENKFKVLMSSIIDAGQKAREAVFKNAKVAEGDEAAEGIVRYADNAARAAIALKEMAAGLQQGTAAKYGRGAVPGKFVSKPGAISDPAQLANVLVGDYQDLVTGELMSSLPDPKLVADPIAQILMNPYILGDKFVSGYEKSVNAAIKRGAKNSANVGDAVAAAPAATPMGPLEKYRPVLGDAIVNQIVKLIGEAGGDVSRVSAAFDTEFIQNNATPIYEAGVTIKNSMGEFIDLLKMVQIPSGAANDINFALKQAGAGAQSIGDIKKRGEMLGITPEQMGTGAGDVADIEQYRQKLIKLGTLLQALDEVGVQVAGSNIVDADFRMLAKTFDQVNKFLAEAAGIEAIKVPAPTNIVDFKKILAELAKVPNLAPELGVLLQKVIKDGVTKGGTDLGELLAKAIDMQPAIAERYNVQKQGRGFAIDGMQAHVAVADNRASLIVLDFLKQFAQSAELIGKGTGVLNANYGGGTAGPYSNKTREQYSSAFGGGFAVNPTDRAKAADALVQETAAQEDNNKAVRDGADLAQKRLADDKEYKQIVEELTLARGAYNALAKIEANNGIATPEERAALEAYIVRLEELGKKSTTAKTAAESLKTTLTDQSKTSAFIAKRDVKAFGEEKSLEAAQKAYDSEATVKETADKRKAQSGRNYENTATQVERNVTGESGRTTKAIVANTGTRVLSIEQEAKARKDASDRIKGIYKEQVEAEKAVQAATKASINQWVTGRYALYDVGNAYQNVSTQLFRVARRIFDITQSYRSYETAFTSVERAMQLDFSDEAGGAKELKDQFIALSETIPVAFEELSRIATLGAQMGIGAKGIVQFTETVAQFAAVTGISADTVAQKFGRIAELTNLDSSDFYKLGSAVTFAGVNAVATESEILTLSESIAAVSNQAGMSTSEVVGLATSLASIGVPAEQARGVFTRVFADIDRAVATGGKKLNSFASVAGMSGDSFSKAWGTDGGSYQVLRNLLGGLNGVEDLTKAFDALGIVETREINTLTRLANNLNVVDGAISDSNSSFGEGKFLLDSFGKTTDNLDSKITIFQNNLKSLGEQLGQIFGGTLKDILDVGSSVVKFMKDMANSPVLQFLTIFSSGTVVLTGVLTGMTAVMAKVTAQIYAFRVAMINSANDTGAIGGITKQVKQLTSVGGGLIELRNKLLTPSPDVRGEIVPVDYSLASFARGEKAKQAYLLKTQNIFVASSREQADSLQRLILLRQHEIDKVMESSAASGIEAATMRSKLATEAFYVEVLGNETSMLTANQYAELKNAAAAEKTAGVKNGEAAARLKNIQVINAETKAAAGVNSSVMGFGSKLMGFLGAAGIAATILTTVVGVVQGIVTAVNEANKLDLAGSGLTVEALKDTITQDTQAWMDNGQAIATQTVQYEKSVPSANKYAAAVAGLSDSLKETYGSQLAMEKATRSQTIAFGSATKELIVNAILANEKIKTLIDKNAEMFNDLAGLGYNLSDVVDAVMGDPTKAKAYLDTIGKGVKDLQSQIDSARGRLASSIEGNMLTGDIGADARAIKALEERKTELEALGQAGKEAMAEIEKAITMNKIIEMSKGYAEAFVGLEAKMKSAAKAGKGMAAVLKEVAAAVISTSNITDSGTILEINSAKSIDEMIKIIKALQLVEIAAKQADLRMDSFGRRALATGTISIATQYDGTIKSLELLANASSEATDAAAKGSETAADKLKRLISEANATKNAIFGLNGALRSLGSSLKESTSWSANTEKGAAKLAAVLGVVEQIGNNAGKNFPKAIRELQVFQIVMSDMGAPKSATDLIANAIKKLGGDSTLSAKQIATLRKQFPQLFSTMLAQIKAGAMPFKTLTTYIGEIRNALQSAFDFRYGKQVALDNLNKSWITLKESATSAAEAIKKANEEIAQTTADRTILEYQLGIAEKYNDQRRAASIRAKLAANSTQKSEQEKALADAKDAGSTVLTGDTKAAIDNRAKIRDLVTTYNNYLISLANTGKSAEDLKTEATKLSAEFLAQGKALGFAEKDLQAYTDAFKTDFTTVINGLPKNITLAVDTDPALRAIAEFVAEANAALAGLNFTGVQVAQPSAAEIKAYKSAKAVIADKKATAAKKKTATAQKKAFESKYGTGYAAGGFVSGSGGAKSDSIPAMLSNGEYVVQASSVKAYGVDFLNALNQQRIGFQPVQPSMGGQQQQSGPQMVYLSPEDRALLRSAVDRPVNLYTENQKIASSANAGNVILAQRGAR